MNCSPRTPRMISRTWRGERPKGSGPVVPIIGAADDDEAVAIANRTRLGLQAAVFTNSLSKAFWYTDRIRAGTVVVRAVTLCTLTKSVSPQTGSSSEYPLRDFFVRIRYVQST